jgi:hypothetical protein
LERTKWQLDVGPNVFALIISLERTMWPLSVNPNIFPLVITLERTKWPRGVNPNIFLNQQVYCQSHYHFLCVEKHKNQRKIIFINTYYMNRSSNSCVKCN